MRIGILSDTHNNVDSLRRALEIFRRESIITLIHCGDMTSPNTAEHLSGFRVIYLTGNMDGDTPALRQTLLDLNPDNWIGPTYTGRIGGVNLAATHGHIPGALEKLVDSGEYAYVFHGHTHERRDETVGQTRVINPGALSGLGHNRFICLLDLDSNEANFVHVSDQ